MEEALRLSAAVLSAALPTAPMERVTPAVWQASANGLAPHWAPWSLWKDRPGQAAMCAFGRVQEEFRRPEFQMLRAPSSNESLRISAVDRDAFGDDLDEWPDRVTLVDRLRETRVLWGFSRVHPQPPTREDGKAMLRAAPVDYSNQWLPAYEVYGEGIYLEFDTDRLAAWESRASVAERVAKLVQQSKAAMRGDTRTGSPFHPAVIS